VVAEAAGAALLHLQVVDASCGVETDTVPAGQPPMRELGLIAVGDADKIFVEAPERQCFATAH